MKTLNDMRQQHPELAHLSNEQLEAVRNRLYKLARIALILASFE
jgi:hypothetical protein